MHQKFDAAHPHHYSIYGQWQVLGVASLEVNNNLLCLADIQRKVLAPAGSEVNLFPVVRFIAFGDESHQSCVVRKLHKMVGAVGWCAVVC